MKVKNLMTKNIENKVKIMIFMKFELALVDKTIVGESLSVYQ